MGNPRTKKKLIDIGKLTQSKKGRVNFLYYNKLPMYLISKANESQPQGYACERQIEKRTDRQVWIHSWKYMKSTWSSLEVAQNEEQTHLGL